MECLLVLLRVRKSYEQDRYLAGQLDHVIWTSLFPSVFPELKTLCKKFDLSPLCSSHSHPLYVSAYDVLSILSDSLKREEILEYLEMIAYLQSSEVFGSKHVLVRCCPVKFTLTEALDQSDKSLELVSSIACSHNHEVSKKSSTQVVESIITKLAHDVGNCHKCLGTGLFLKSVKVPWSIPFSAFHGDVDIKRNLHLGFQKATTVCSLYLFDDSILCFRQLHSCNSFQKVDTRHHIITVAHLSSDEKQVEFSYFNNKHHVLVKDSSETTWNEPLPLDVECMGKMKIGESDKWQVFCVPEWGLGHSKSSRGHLFILVPSRYVSLIPTKSSREDGQVRVHTTGDPVTSKVLSLAYKS